MEAFWEQVGDALRARVSPADWCSWFTGAEAVELGPESITVSLVNEFAVRWVDERFSEALTQCVERVAGVRLDVCLVARASVTAVEGAAPRPGLTDEAMPAASAAAAALGENGGLNGVDARPHGAVRAAAAGSRPTNAMTEAELRAELGLAAAGSAAASASAAAGPVGATSGPSAGAATSAGAGPATGAQRLNDRYRFDTFVIGGANQLAHSSALTVAEAPAQSYNPLFIHGGTGLGKTHLLHAIGHYVRQTRPSAHVAYLTTEGFVTAFSRVMASTRGPAGQRSYADRDRFKEFFRSVDVLLLDDVQFLAGKTHFQEELFHIFNTLLETGRQVVLTSRCEPDRIPRIEEGLGSRFAWGLITDIAAPDVATRIAILRKKAQAERIAIPAAVFAEIAERVVGSVRELEGALTRVVAIASMRGGAPTAVLAAEVLEAYAPAPAGPVTIDRIQGVVCDHFHLTREEMLSTRRAQPLARPRQIAMYLSRVVAGAPSTQVAERFNRKDHSTVLYAARKVEELMRSDRDVHDLVDRLTETLRRGAGTSDTGAAPARSVTHAG